MRSSLVSLVSTLGLLAACSEPKKLGCEDSIANLCALSGECALTWAEAQNDTSFCAGGFPFPNSRADCGGYHVVSVNITDLTTNYYYDATTGMLAAIVAVSGLGTQCVAGPSAGFTPPQCTDGSQGLSQCFDAGVDGSTGDAATD